MRAFLVATAVGVCRLRLPGQAHVPELLSCCACTPVAVMTYRSACMCMSVLSQLTAMHSLAAVH